MVAIACPDCWLRERWCCYRSTPRQCSCFCIACFSSERRFADISGIAAAAGDDTTGRKTRERTGVSVPPSVEDAIADR